MFYKLLTLLSLLSLTAAHFEIEYPFWRGDSFEGAASQWIYPCANVNSTPTSDANRTRWPATGGSLRLHVTHPWALTYVNLGLAELPNNTVASFNASLLAAYNQTGNGTFCLPEIGGGGGGGEGALEGLAREAGVEGGARGLEGRNATIQVVQIGHGGSALYNCADITFASNATTLSTDQCSNSTGVGGIEITNVDSATAGGGGANASSTAPGATATGGASGGLGDGIPGMNVLMVMGVFWVLRAAAGSRW